MTHFINGHAVEFFSHGRISVDGKAITLAIRATNGGHYTHIAVDSTAVSHPGFEAMAGRKLTGPRKPIGSYEAGLAAEIVALLHP